MEANNMAAMREALEMMSDLFEKGVICISYENSPKEVGQIEELYHKVKAALSAPPRNCDVGTAEEQYARLSKFCDLYDCNIKCPLYGDKSCLFSWAQMPYEADESEVEKWD